MVSRQTLSRKKLKILSASRIKLLSPAKLNLYLNVVGKYSNGFHQIESITEKIDLCDTIDIQLNDLGQNKFICDRKDLQTKDNLCLKALELITSRYNCKQTFTINLFKRIPVGAGLGGGSSNAAAVLKGVDHLLGLKLTDQEFFDLGSRLGSDVNLFLTDSSYAFLQGRGEIVTPLNYKTKLRHLIVWPNAFLSTKTVYKKFKFGVTNNLDNKAIIMYSIRQNDVSLIRQSIFNALESMALSLCRPMTKAKDLFLKQGIDLRVTGSGSALYSVFSPLSPIKRFKDFPKSWQMFDVETF